MCINLHCPINQGSVQMQQAPFLLVLRSQAQRGEAVAASTRWEDLTGNLKAIGSSARAHAKSLGPRISSEGGSRLPFASSAAEYCTGRRSKVQKHGEQQIGRVGWEQLAMVRLRLYLSLWITVRSTYIHCPINQGSVQKQQAPFPLVLRSQAQRGEAVAASTRWEDLTGNLKAIGSSARAHALTRK